MRNQESFCQSNFLHLELFRDLESISTFHAGSHLSEEQTLLYSMNLLCGEEWLRVDNHLACCEGCAELAENTVMAADILSDSDTRVWLRRCGRQALEVTGSQSFRMTLLKMSIAANVILALTFILLTIIITGKPRFQELPLNGKQPDRPSIMQMDSNGVGTPIVKSFDRDKKLEALGEISLDEILQLLASGSNSLGTIQNNDDP